MEAVKHKGTTSDLMATFYANCIIATERTSVEYTQGESWVYLNKAIIKRWPKGLLNIKKMAWKIVEEHRKKHIC